MFNCGVSWVDGIIISLTNITMCFDGVFVGILSAQQLKKSAFINMWHTAEKVPRICKTSPISRYRHVEGIEINLNGYLSAFGC